MLRRIRIPVCMKMKTVILRIALGLAVLGAVGCKVITVLTRAIPDRTMLDTVDRIMEGIRAQ